MTHELRGSTFNRHVNRSSRAGHYFDRINRCGARWSAAHSHTHTDTHARSPSLAADQAAPGLVRRLVSRGDKDNPLPGSSCLSYETRGYCRGPWVWGILAWILGGITRRENTLDLIRFDHFENPPRTRESESTAHAQLFIHFLMRPHGALTNMYTISENLATGPVLCVPLPPVFLVFRMHYIRDCMQLWQLNFGRPARGSVHQRVPRRSSSDGPNATHRPKAAQV